SFSDGGRFSDFGAAWEQAQRMQADGAAIIDIGGESTRPGSERVAPAVEIERTVALIERIATHLDIAVSIDTSEPDVMRAAVRAGACIVNDIGALRAPGAREACAELGVGVCLMHMKGEPRTMQDDPHYGDVVGEISEFLQAERA